MHFSQIQYLPLPFLFFSALVGIFLVILVLLQIGVLRYAYMRLGLSSGAAMLVLFGSLIGSYFNIPVANLPQQRIMTGQEVIIFGMPYVVPVVADWPGTVIAVNVGGALIPLITSLYLLVKHQIWLLGALAIAGVAFVCHSLAQPVPGLGIAVPILVPALSSALAAWLLSRRHAAQLAYIGGSMGCLLGADLLNFGKLSGLGAPVASIGGAGTFDGVFLTGVVAVLIASLTGPPPGAPAQPRRRTGQSPWS